MAALISGGLISSISAMTWAGPRVAQAVGQDFPALRFFARTSPGGVPRVAIGGPDSARLDNACHCDV